MIIEFLFHFSRFLVFNRQILSSGLFYNSIRLLVYFEEILPTRCLSSLWIQIENNRLVSKLFNI